MEVALHSDSWGGADERSAVACCRPLVERQKRSRARRSVRHDGKRLSRDTLSASNAGGRAHGQMAYGLRVFGGSIEMLSFSAGLWVCVM